jgi:hypothetical protein
MEHWFSDEQKLKTVSDHIMLNVTEAEEELKILYQNGNWKIMERYL